MAEPIDQLDPTTAAHPGPALSVVAPCYNEEEVLPEFHRRVSAACRAVVASYEIVLVDDGSTDATWSVLSRIAKDDPCVVAVKLSRNHGQALALAAGLSVCRGERVLVIDADLQDPPELLPELLARMDRGADVVYEVTGHWAAEPELKAAGAAVIGQGLSAVQSAEEAINKGVSAVQSGVDAAGKGISAAGEQLREAAERLGHSAPATPVEPSFKGDGGRSGGSGASGES